MANKFWSEIDKVMSLAGVLFSMSSCIFYFLFPFRPFRISNGIALMNFESEVKPANNEF